MRRNFTKKSLTLGFQTAQSRELKQDQSLAVLDDAANSRGTIHLRHRHFLGSRGQKFAKSGDR